MALGIEMEKKRKAVQMSAAAVSFFLDREGHLEFLRAATNQELEAENKRLREELERKTQECVYYYTELCSSENTNQFYNEKIDGLEANAESAGHCINKYREKVDRLEACAASAEKCIDELRVQLTNSWRPQHKDINWLKDGFEGEHTARDCFLMDFENAVLEDFQKVYPGEEIPTGPERHKNKEWAALMWESVYPHHSDVDWSEYATWVRQGGGDEWFTGDHSGLGK